MKTGVLAKIFLTCLIGFPMAAWAGIGTDSDGDGVIDENDNCSALANAAPLNCDADLDGYGNLCDGDTNNNLAVTGPDFSAFVTAFTSGAPLADVNCNGSVTGPDFGAYVPLFTGGVIGPSGLPCAGVISCTP